MLLKMEVLKPDSVEVEARIVMTLAHWRVLLNEFDLSEKKGGSPLWDLRQVLRETVSKIESEFESSVIREGG